MKRSFLTASGILAAALVAFAVPASAQTKPQIQREPAKSIVSIEGRDNYVAYCAVCHGKDAKGAGPAAPALKATVPDLTTLARRNGGKFDAVAVQRVVTGEDKLIAAHGTEDMPIWGPVFRGMTGGDHPGILRVRNLVVYLESIQQK